MTAWNVEAPWAERYEQLRAHATGQVPLDFIPLSLALLQHRGVVAWMTAVASGDDADIRRPRDRTDDALDAHRRELVRLLAGVALPLALRSAP